MRVQYIEGEWESEEEEEEEVEEEYRCSMSIGKC